MATLRLWARAQEDSSTVEKMAAQRLTLEWTLEAQGFRVYGLGFRV